MAVNFRTDIGTIIEAINKSLHDGIKAKLIEGLRKQADIIVEEMAEELAKSIKGMIYEYHQPMSGDINIALYLDRVEKKI